MDKSFLIIPVVGHFGYFQVFTLTNSEIVYVEHLCTSQFKSLNSEVWNLSIKEYVLFKRFQTHFFVCFFYFCLLLFLFLFCCGHILPDYFSGILNQVLLLPGVSISDVNTDRNWIFLFFVFFILSNQERYVCHFHLHLSSFIENYTAFNHIL